MNLQNKKIKILKLLMKIDDLLVSNFFNINSNKNLDLKIEVLTKLSNGVKPIDIKEYYDILELYPKNAKIWD